MIATIQFLLVALFMNLVAVLHHATSACVLVGFVKNITINSRDSKIKQVNMYCSYSCYFPCLVSLIETCLCHSVLKGEQCPGSLTDGFFSFYASSKKMCCMSHNGCDGVTLLFYILQS